MERRLEDAKSLKCHMCGGAMCPIVTDLPFKVSERSIVIIKALPLFQCDNCREYLLEDAVMARVEAILERAGKTTELEVVQFAA